MIRRLLAATLLAVTAACRGDKDEADTKSTQTPESMHTYILVHGAWADVHAWDAVVPLLKSAGHSVVAVNLPAHGADTTAATAVHLADYVRVVRSAVEQSPTPVMLVGHSMAGMVVSQVAEEIPERITQLVYVAAYLPASGQKLLDLAGTDSASLVGANLEFATDGSSATIKRSVLGDALCAECPQPVKDAIMQFHKAEPAGPLGEPVTLTAARWGAVPKIYISTTADRAVSTALQERMLAANGGITDIRRIDTGHLPFVSRPDEFVALLTRP